MVVAIDGSTYKYHPFFDHWVVDKIKELIDPGLEVLWAFLIEFLLNQYSIFSVQSRADW